MKNNLLVLEITKNNKRVLKNLCIIEDKNAENIKIKIEKEIGRYLDRYLTYLLSLLKEYESQGEHRDITLIKYNQNKIYEILEEDFDYIIKLDLVYDLTSWFDFNINQLQYSLYHALPNIKNLNPKFHLVKILTLKSN